MLAENRFLSSEQIQGVSDNQNSKEILSQIRDLEGDEFGFWCSEEESRLFASLELKHETPNSITHAVIDSDRSSEHPFSSIFKQLSQLGCQAAQLRFFESSESQKIETILELTQKNGFTDIELVMPSNGNSNTNIGRLLSQRFPVLTKLIFHSASANQLLSNEKEECPIYQITNKINSADHCGFIHPDGFVVNKDMLELSKAHNNCLHGKLAIDINGNIKNCPAMIPSFGNVNQNKLEEVLQEAAFERLWNVGKDQISICKDCEFRYICTDCRAFISNEDDELSKPSRCSYNPYLTKWV